MNGNIGSDIRGLIAAANKKRAQMQAAGYRQDVIDTKYADALAFIKSQYTSEMDRRIDEERHKLTMIKAKYEDKVRDGTPDAVQLSLYQSKLRTMTNAQLMQLSVEVRLGNSRDTYVLPYETRLLGEEFRKRNLDKEADQIGLFCEAANVDDPARSDPEYKETDGRIQKLTVLKNMASEGNMFVLPVGNNLNITQKEILPFSKLSEVV
jgi:hypothetical protein